MIVANTIYYHNQDFADYLAMPGISFSGLKDEVIATEGMKLGTRVHNYLNEPDKYDWKQAEIVLPIAKAIRMHIGDAFNFLDKEVAFSSDFIHNGMLLKYKGRADMMFTGRIIIDIKVLSGSIQSAIERFGYDKQISGYCLATGAKLGLIISWNKPAKRVETKLIKPSKDFWEYQCVHRGMPMEVANK